MTKKLNEFLKEGYLEMASEIEDMMQVFESLDRESLRHLEKISV